MGGRRAGRADWWEDAQARGCLLNLLSLQYGATCSGRASPPGSQARGRAGVWLGQGGARRAGQEGGGLVGRAGGRVGWMEAAGMKGVASTLQWSLPAHTTHPRPSALCPTPTCHPPALCGSCIAHLPSVWCPLPRYRVGPRYISIRQQPRARRRGSALSPFCPRLSPCHPCCFRAHGLRGPRTLDTQ